MASATIGTEVEIVPLSGVIPGAYGGQAVIYGVIRANGRSRVGYYEIVPPTGPGGKAVVYHSETPDMVFVQSTKAP